MTRVYRQFIAAFDDAAHRVDIREVEPRWDSLRVEIHRERDEIDVPRAFAIAEQAALDAIGTRKERHFRCCDRGAPVIVRMDRQHDTVR